MSVRELCLAGLQRSYDPVVGLWNRQLRAGRWTATRGTEDVTSTCICLIALNRAGVRAFFEAAVVGRAVEVRRARVLQHAEQYGIPLELASAIDFGVFGLAFSSACTARRLGRPRR